ncbi:MAG: PKD domain-containing protein, partial [Bacteroidota bacterium]
NPPTQTYPGAGYYSVLLTGNVQASSPPGGACADGVLHDILIPVEAGFDHSTACPGAPVNFEDKSVFIPPAGITAWSWDFGDPASGAANSSNLTNPSHVFAAPGNYTVELTITSSGGCQTSFSKMVTVHQPPSIQFLPPALTCENAPLPFSAQLFSDVTSVSWNFGEPASGAANTSELFDSWHEFENPGSYLVTLTASNVYGCTATFSSNVSVTPNTLSGNISMNPGSPICEGASSTLTAPGGTSWEWSTGEATASITASTSNVYSVTLTNPQGCIYTPPPAILEVVAEPNGIIKAVEYNEFGQPVAFFENSHSVCEGEDVFLVIQGSVNNSYVWSNGETGDEVSFEEIKNNLLATGSHNFSVTVTDGVTGCTSVEGPFTVNVNPVPTVQIASAPSGFLCENQPATLNVVAPQPGLTYSWNTGEIGTSISVVAGGTYFARAVNIFGCRGKSNEIELHNAPDIGKIPTGCHTRCQPDTMCLPDIQDVASYQWFFNGSPMPAPNGSQANPIFSQSGEYFVEMTDVFGCISTSEVLSLDLQPGVGDIGGEVYFDVNKNGVIDAGDTLVSNVQIFIGNGSVNLDTVSSDLLGNYLFDSILAQNYTLKIDTLNLPPLWSAVLASTTV